MKHIFEEMIEKDCTTFNAGWRAFEIKFCKTLKSSGEKVYGEADFDKCTISLEKSMDHATARHTLLHEICHVLLETMGLGGHHEVKEDCIESTNEIITESMARAMMMAYKLNPELWSIIFNEQSR